MVLNKRLIEDIEEKKILPESQAGFRKNRGTMDNVYILHHIVERELIKKGGKIVSFFVDLKAAFDKVHRKKLWETMAARGVKGSLTERVKEIYAETINAVRVNGSLTEEFWTEEGVRQGCLLSPTLFTILISDMDEEMRKEIVGGIIVGREKFWSLAYADDVVLLANHEEDLRELIKRFEKFLDKKSLILNAEKSKIYKK